MKFKHYLKESSLSRIWKHNKEHDCGALSAFRSNYSRKENEQRNKSLLAKLKSKGYGVTKLNGIYPEGGKEGKENSFFVVDLNDSGKLFDDLKKLGEHFDQDSILFIPKNSISGENKAFLFGTNHEKNNFISYGQKLPFEKGKLGYKSPIYTSYVNGRPFIFEDVENEVLNPQTGYGNWAMNVVAEKDWRDIEI